MEHTFETPKLASKPITGFTAVKTKAGHTVTLYGGYIPHKGKHQATAGEVEALSAALKTPMSAGIKIDGEVYRLMKNKPIATVITAIATAMDGIDYTIRCFKDIIIITAGRIRVYFRPSKKLVILPKEFADIIDEELSAKLHVVLI